MYFNIFLNGSMTFGEKKKKKKKRISYLLLSYFSLSQAELDLVRTSLLCKSAVAATIHQTKTNERLFINWSPFY